MRYLTVTLLTACLLPLSAVAEKHHEHHEHAHEAEQATAKRDKHKGHAEHATPNTSSLDAHEHGAAKMNFALDGQTLELELESPSFNIVGFEHAPSTEAQKATLEKARQALSAPLSLFGIPAAAQCSVDQQALESPLFAAPGEHKSSHSEIHARYQLTCTNPQALTALELGLFKQFPHVEKLFVQVISSQGQDAATLTAKQPSLSLQ